MQFYVRGKQLNSNQIQGAGTREAYNFLDFYNDCKSHRERIEIESDAKTDAQRDALFKEMRTGKKKIMIGSTDKCGTGVNVQTHITALHHCDCPWKPASITQREGRALRQGNENEEVAIYRYVTKSTFDTVLLVII